MLRMKPRRTKKPFVTPAEPLSLSTLVRERKPRKRTPAPKKKQPPRPLITMHDKKRLVALRLQNPPVKTPRVPRQVMGRQQLPPLPDYLDPHYYCLYHSLMPGAWSGHPAFIVGGGPSLRRFNWDKLNGRLVIGINRALERCTPALNVSMDVMQFGRFETAQFGPEAFSTWQSYPGYRVWWSRGDYVYPPMDAEHPYVIHTVEPAASFSTDTLKRLYAGSNSGMLALTLAATLGANPIYLLGYDMKGGQDGLQKWWHDGYEKACGAEVYDMFRSQFDDVADKLVHRNIRVVNLNSRSALTAFPRSSWSKSVKPGPRRPIATSFHTPDAGYSKEAARLRKSCCLFGLEMDIREVPTRGSWLQNVRRKPHHLLSVLDAHPGRDIVWLDSDAEVVAYPTLLDDAKCDIGMVWVDWSKLPVTRNDRELLSGTIYVRNSAPARAFLHAWIKALDASPTAVDQTGFRKTVAAMPRGITYLTLPPAYCQIFDTMAASGPPVIEQFQASRRLKKGI